jgi:hypothetical protein
MSSNRSPEKEEREAIDTDIGPTMSAIVTIERIKEGFKKMNGSTLQIELNLHVVPEFARETCEAAFAKGDAAGFLLSTDNELGLRLVFDNLSQLRERGIYEEALLRALTGSRTNNHRCPQDRLDLLLDAADREKLRAAGDPLPGPGPFTAYRGVAGHGRSRRIRGLSWTLSLEKAQWFARRGERSGLAKPAVFTAEIPKENVVAYCRDRDEEELLVWPFPATNPKSLGPPPPDPETHEE